MSFLAYHNRREVCLVERVLVSPGGRYLAVVVEIGASSGGSFTEVFVYDREAPDEDPVRLEVPGLP